MNVLLIDDDRALVETVLDALGDLEPAIAVTVVSSKASALAAVNQFDFDLLLCDLSLPSVDGSLDEDIGYGITVYSEARRHCPGTPIVILTGHGEENIDFVAQALADAPREDLFGDSQPIALTQFIRKARLDDCIRMVVDFFHKLRMLDDQIEIAGADSSLTPAERRLLRIFARRHNGAIVEVHPLGGGLSSSKTLRTTVRDSALAKRARAVGKLGSFEMVDDELRRYRHHIVPLLGPGSFTAYSGEVRAGSGGIAGLFYTLAEEYPYTLFDILQRSEDDALQVLDRLVELERPWTESATSKRVRVEELRQKLISHARFVSEANVLRKHVPIDQVERCSVTVRQCPRHGDLHGLNVLVTGDGRPVLIDYGDVEIWSSAYDMVVLELSLLFHPAAVRFRGTWPSPEAAKYWSDIERYCVDCPFPRFVRRCRDYAHTVAAAPKEVMANAYAFAMRQLKYPNTDRDLIIGIAQSAATRLLAN
jgi:CheY-like chemotaxis protein